MRFTPRLPTTGRTFGPSAQTRLAKNHPAIFVGEGDAQKLTGTRMAKSVLNAGGSTFRTRLQYKCDDAGVGFKQIDEKFFAQECSSCGARAVWLTATVDEESTAP